MFDKWQSNKFDKQLFEAKPYNSEADLIETVLANRSKFLPKQNLVVSREVRIGSGIVDIVIGQAHTQNLKLRVNSERFSDLQIDGIEAVILAQLFRKQPLLASTIAKYLGINQDKIEVSLKKLTEIGLCVQPSNTTFLRAPVTDQFMMLVSIEGKLRSWKKALEQAYRNRLFSAVSYVVLDAKYSRPAISNIRRFKSYGIGLAVAQSENNKIKIIFRPPISNPKSKISFVLAREILTRNVINKTAELSDELHEIIY